MNRFATILASRAIGPYQSESARLRAGDFIASHYRYFRQRRRLPAVKALSLARTYPPAYVKGVGYYGESGGAGRVFERGQDRLRWIESTESVGLRFIGWSDEINKRMRHTGWLCDEFGDSSLRGGVWQLPGTGGHARLVYGYAEWEGSREMNPGSACLNMEIISIRQNDAGYSVDLTDESATHDCAAWADSMAEREAESRRTYNEAYQAGRQAGEATQEALDARSSLLALLIDMRDKFIPCERQGPVWERLYGLVGAFVESIRAARAKRDSAWRDCPVSMESAWLSGFSDELLAADYRAALIAMGLRARLDSDLLAESAQ